MSAAIVILPLYDVRSRRRVPATMVQAYQTLVVAAPKRSAATSSMTPMPATMIATTRSSVALSTTA
ncbi:MAG: hypothetical protein E2O35_10365 [Proteobacteria bacterium]|nr:MAG: hypothetical protein E2O35_10365 [Pseudomonadota bacterium]